jgi:hypothetical protein
MRSCTFGHAQRSSVRLAARLAGRAWERKRTKEKAVLVCVLASAFCAFPQGCGSSHEESAYDRQEQALKDPFGYNSDPKKSQPTVTGDGDKDALKRDVDHVLNP